MIAATTDPLDEEEQRQLIHDIEGALDGEDIGGYTVSSEGWCWIDFEGPEASVESVVEDIVADVRIGEYEIDYQGSPDERALQTEWYGFDEASAALELDF